MENYAEKLKAQHAFFAERSHRNAQIAYDNAKTVGQSLILINGGAATAVLAFIAKQNAQAVPWLACAGLLLFAVGVAVGTYMVYALYRNNMRWNRYFQGLVWTDPHNEEHKKQGEQWERYAAYAGAASAALFLLACLFLALAFGSMS